MKVGNWKSTTHSKSFELGLLFICAVAIFLIEQVRWDSVMRNNIQAFASPAAKITNQAASILMTPALAIEQYMTSALTMNQLKIEYSKTLSELSELEQLREENSRLREMLENKSFQDANQVVTAPITSYAYPAVAAGSKHGVSSGQIVLANGTFLGLVTEVSDQHSKVSLLSSVDSPPLLVTTGEDVRGLIRGNGKRVKLTQVSPDQELVVGEEILTIGQPGIPAGLLVGIVVSVDPRTSESTQTASIDQLVSFYTTPLVEVR